MALNAIVGSTTGNSYVTAEEADTYFADRVHSSTWDTFEQKDEVLITSSQMLDWYFNWKGTKATSSQYMKWPRLTATRRDGSLVDETTIPPEIKVAVYELALSSVTEDRTSDNPLFGLSEVKVSTLLAKATSTGSATVKEAIPEKVKKIVSELYTKGSINVVRLMRG